MGSALFLDILGLLFVSSYCFLSWTWFIQIRYENTFFKYPEIALPLIQKSR